MSPSYKKLSLIYYNSAVYANTNSERAEKNMANGKYDQKELDVMADTFNAYLDVIKTYVIIDGITKEEYEEALDTLKDLVKKLRKGKGDKVFNQERYFELKSQGNVIL